jgi:hypothetical protein
LSKKISETAGRNELPVLGQTFQNFATLNQIKITAKKRDERAKFLVQTIQNDGRIWIGKDGKQCFGNGSQAPVSTATTSTTTTATTTTTSTNAITTTTTLVQQSQLQSQPQPQSQSQSQPSQSLLQSQPQLQPQPQPQGQTQSLAQQQLTQERQKYFSERDGVVYCCCSTPQRAYCGQANPKNNLTKSLFFCCTSDICNYFQWISEISPTFYRNQANSMNPRYTGRKYQISQQL